MPRYRRRMRRFKRRRSSRRLYRRKNVLKLGRLPRGFRNGATSSVIRNELVLWSTIQGLIAAGASTYTATPTMNEIQIAGGLVTARAVSALNAQPRSTTDIEPFINSYDDVRVVGVKWTCYVYLNQADVNDIAYSTIFFACGYSTQPGVAPVTTLCDTYTSGFQAQYIANDMMNPKLVVKFKQVKDTFMPVANQFIPLVRQGLGLKLFKVSVYCNFLKQIEGYARNDLGWCSITGATGARTIGAPAAAEGVIFRMFWRLNANMVAADGSYLGFMEYTKYYCQWRHPRDAV